MAERRKDYRVPCELHTTLKKGTLSYPCKVTDISLHGCCLTLSCNHELKLGHVVLITLNDITETVVHAKIVNLSLDEETVLHLKFTLFPSTEEKLIRECVMHLQRIYLKKKRYSSKPEENTVSPAYDSNHPPQPSSSETPPQSTDFTPEEINILKSMISAHRSRELLLNPSSTPEEILNDSNIEGYAREYHDFMSWCSSHNTSPITVLSQVMRLLSRIK